MKNPKTLEDFVIGSGPAGISAAWALIKKGRTVTMLDVGEQLESEKSELRSRLASVEPKNWLEKDITSYTYRRRSEEIDCALPFGSDFLFRDPTNFTDEQKKNTSIGLRPSFAKGGLSNGWGASILPYRQEDIMDWPASTRKLNEHYEALREFMPMAGVADDLKELFPMLSMEKNTSLTPSSQAKEFLARLETKKTYLNQSGIYFGHARQAASSNDCRSCGMCLYGCPYGVVYSAAHTLEKLMKNKLFSYKKGYFVTRFEEQNDSVKLWANNITTDQEVQFSAKRIFVASGVLPSTQLVLNSLEYYNKPIYMKDSQHFLMPLLHSWFIKQNPITEETNSLVQLFFEIIGSDVHKKTAHIQLYTFNDLFAVDMRKRFGPFAKLFTPLISQLSQRLVVAQGFLHSDYSAKIEVRLIKGKKKARLHLKALGNSKTDNAIAHIKSKLYKISRTAGILPLTPLSRVGPVGSSFHCGSTFPMKENPTGLDSDTLGRPAGLQRVFVIDASVFPSIPATTITLSVMANAHRIAMESVKIAD